MRVAMVGDEFYPDTGGVPTYTWGLGEALAKLDVEPILFTHAHLGRPEEEEIGGLRVKRLNGFVAPRLDRALSFRIARDLHRDIKFGRFDIVHGQDIYSSMALQSIHSAYKCGVPSVLTCHSVHKTGWFWKLIHQPLVITMKIADRIIAVSNATAEFCRELGVSNRKIKVIMNGVDPSKFNPADGSWMRTRLGLGSEPLVVTAIRLVKRKGAEHLVAAFPKVLQRVPDAKLAIAGGGSEAANLHALIKKLGIENSTFMLGTLSREQVIKLIVAADIFVLPSLMESFGLVLLEAMAAGVSIVCTRVGGVPEIVEDEINGLMVPPADADALADAILRVLDDGELAKKLRANGLRVAREKFSWEKTARETLTLYETMCGEHAKYRPHY
ncbi:MAG: glycosyltransferase family 4 protein [Candidatus Hodarchaeaceae archaeon]|nr:glycosyltransferase family 4 protein [Candidatus Hodarchaeaceae archaeon]